MVRVISCISKVISGVYSVRIDVATTVIDYGFLTGAMGKCKGFLCTMDAFLDVNLFLSGSE